MSETCPNCTVDDKGHFILCEKCMKEWEDAQHEALRWAHMQEPYKETQ